jgi:hypothetical protein
MKEGGYHIQSLWLLTNCFMRHAHLRSLEPQGMFISQLVPHSEQAHTWYAQCLRQQALEESQDQGASPILLLHGGQAAPQARPAEFGKQGTRHYWGNPHHSYVCVRRHILQPNVNRVQKIAKDLTEVRELKGLTYRISVRNWCSVHICNILHDLFRTGNSEGQRVFLQQTAIPVKGSTFQSRKK